MPLLERLLQNRGIISATEVRDFLTPQLRDLYPPNALHGTTDAARLIVDAVRAKRKIVLYGDYDVDGTTSVAILWHLLHGAGADLTCYVPHRIEEGYGLNAAACMALADQGAQLVITTDCGMTGHEAAAELARRGVSLIITDHHQWHEPLPTAAAIVHPGLGGTYPNPHLCGAGVAFKLAWAIAQEFSASEKVTPELRDLLSDLLPLAALGTIADIVPLRGENRIIAVHGLDRLARTRIPGLVALMESVGLRGQSIGGYDVGFKLAPRINAAGRMGHADLAIELFTTADGKRAAEIAAYLDDHNRSRQATERKITAQAVAMVAEQGLASDARRAIVIGQEGWHPGVIGIVAARLVGRFHRPAVVVAFSEGQGQGSARSIAHFHLAEALKECEADLLSCGGHAMAAGLRVARDRFDAFTERFVAVANARLTGRDLIPKITIDAEVHLNELGLPVVQSIHQLGPFGCENPKPRLATQWLELAAEPRCVGQTGKHLQAVFSQDGVALKAIGFGLGDALNDLKHHRRCKVAFEPIISDFGGRRSVELQIIDFKFPD
ncbi:MAG: single-stranded-DNA-specific exonuclease RecJ [Phycisphaerae bacterium]